LIWGNLSAQNNRIKLNNGQDVFLSGMNIAWMDFANDMDNFSYSSWESQLKAVKAEGGNCVRLWLHITGAKSPSFNGNAVSGISTTALNNLKSAMDKSETEDMTVILCLWSFDMLEAAKYGTSLTNRNKAFLDDNTNVQSYIDKALIPMVNKIKGHKALVAWEIFNEPEGMTNEVDGWVPASGSTQVTMKRIQYFINKCAGAIHRTDATALVTNGAKEFYSSSDTNAPDWWSGFEEKNYYKNSELLAAGGDADGFLDFYCVHFYGWMEDFYSPFSHPASYWGLDKPIVIAEFRADGDFEGCKNCSPMTVTAMWEYLYNNGYAGALGWQMYNGEMGGLNAAKPGIKNLSTKYPSSINVNFSQTAVNAPGVFALSSPVNVTDVSSNVTFTWGTSSEATSYTLVVSVNSNLSNPVVSKTGLTTTSFQASLISGTKYYWQVTALNDKGSKLASNGSATFTTAVKFATSIDNFETYTPNSALTAAYVKNAQGNIITVSLNTQNKSEGVQAMKIDFTIGTPNYCGIEKIINQDWSGYSGVQFWLKGEYPSNSITLQFQEASGEYWETTLNINSASGSTKYVPFSQFANPSWNGAKIDGVLALGTIQKIGLYFGGNAGSGSIYLDDIKLSNGNPTSIVSLSEVLRGIYPNPATTSVTIDLNDMNGLAHVSIINQMGQLVSKTESISDSPIVLNVSHFTQGVYYVVVVTSAKKYTGKLLIQ